MSILIKGMEMPHNCEECGLTSHRPEGLGLCHILHKQCNYDTRPKDCPLVEVPEPHGRLIDFNELKKDLIKKWNVNDDQDFCNKEVWHALEEAPTVIKAEEDEENDRD